MRVEGEGKERRSKLTMRSKQGRVEELRAGESEAVSAQERWSARDPPQKEGCCEHTTRARTTRGARTKGEGGTSSRARDQTRATG